MRRRVAAIIVAVVVVALGVGGLAATGATSHRDAPGTQPTPAATATIELRTLTATTQVDGTLGYAGTYPIANLMTATHGVDVPDVITLIGGAGSIVEPGGILYILDASSPAVLMTGTVPAWRALQPGVSDGPDVQQLESNLQAMGVAPSLMVVDRHWDAQTTQAVKRWQSSLGLAQTGAIPLGQIVFEPVALRVTSVAADLGSIVQRGSPIIQATSTDRVVAVALDPALQTQVKSGDQVSITLPSGKSTPGTVSKIGTVATAPAGNPGIGGSSGSAASSIAITITLNDPTAGGSLDQAPVTVNITTATAVNALAVPVSALVELLEGGYAVQIYAAGQLHYEPVKLGLFANGYVEITGAGIAVGQTVVIAQ